MENTPENQNTNIPVQVEPIQSQSSATPKSQPIFIGSILILFGVFLGVLASRFLPMSKITLPPSTPTSIVTPSPTFSPELTAEQDAALDPTANWKTYQDKNSLFSFRYPKEYLLSPYEENNNQGIQVVSSEQPNVLVDGLMFKLVLVPTSKTSRSSAQQDLAQEIQNDSNTYNYSDLKEIAVGTNTGYSFLISPLNQDSGEAGGANVEIIYVSLNQTHLLKITYYYSNQSPQAAVYIKTANQIISTFKFTDQPSAEGKFCGGIAANLPENQCPAGFYCKKDGNYPDAGGVCTKR